MHAAPSLARVVLAAVLGAAPMAPSARAQESEHASDAPDHTAALVRDVAAHELCPRVEGGFYPLSASSGGDGDEARVVGRLWVQSCRARQAGGEGQGGEDAEGRGLTLELGGVGWRWVERAKERFGARFQLEDTLRFRFGLQASAAADLGYDPARRVAVLRLVPRSEPDVTVEVVGEPDVDTEGVWGEILSTAADAVEKGAEGSFQQKARANFRGSIQEGISVGYDLCSGRITASTGKLGPADFSGPRLEPAPPDWSSSGALRIHAGSFDVAGPFAQSGEPLHVRIQVDRGSLRAALVCAEDADPLVERLVEQGEVPAMAEGTAQEEARIAPGATRTLSLATRPCPLVLMGLPEEGGETPVEYRFVAYGDGERSPLVPCPEAAETSGARPEAASGPAEPPRRGRAVDA
jgi:hypothetical protein